MLKQLILVAGILFLSALVNSIIGRRKKEWFPLNFTKFKETKKNDFKGSKELIKSLDSVITAEGILAVIIYLVVVILYSVLVVYLL